MADALVWECIKNNNSFLVKRGRAKRVGAVQFSSERFNLTKTNAFKTSGLANSKALDIDVGADGKLALLSKSKKALSKPAKLAHKTLLNKAPRTSAKSIAVLTDKSGYRPDLKKAALARMSALKRYTKVKAGVVKPTPVKKGRGSKA